MQVWAVTFNSHQVASLNALYERALLLLDERSQERVRRYYHQEDRFRGLISRLLPRVLLMERGVCLSQMTFGATAAGKPFITTETLPDPIGYSITHDNGVIAMAFASGEDLYHDPPAHRVGVDVMKLQLPRRETFAGFVEVFGDQLTTLEKNLLSLSPQLSQFEALRRFYLIWTLKEAYTKALGLGLGFDFKRIEYDVPRDIVRIDGVVPRGWKFVKFNLQNEREAAETYVGVAAMFIRGEVDQGECTVQSPDTAGAWLTVYDAFDFLEKAIQGLHK